MKFLTNVLIVSDDNKLTDNPTGEESFFGQSTILLNSFLFTTDSFPSVLTKNLNKNEDYWLNGESFPFLVQDIKIAPALNATYSNVAINSFSTSSTIFNYISQSYSIVSIDGAGTLNLNKLNNFGEFIIEDRNVDGAILTSQDGYAIWKNPGLETIQYKDSYISDTTLLPGMLHYNGYYDIGGFSNTRSYLSQFSFRTTNILSLSYSILNGYPATNSFGLSSGATSSASAGYNNVDFYHNLNNSYPIVTFWAYTASTWQMLYTNGLSGVCTTFSYYLYENSVRISFTGSLPTTLIQISIIG